MLQKTILKLVSDHQMSLSPLYTPFRMKQHSLSYPPQTLTRVRYHLFVQILQEFGMLPIRISGPMTPPFRLPYLGHSTTSQTMNMW